MSPDTRAVKRFQRLAAACGLLLLGVAYLHAAESPVAALPDPLTLEYALALADEPHPDLEQARADLDQAEAARLAVEAQMGINMGVEGRAQWVEPAEQATDQSHNDSSAAFYVQKRLYDFGRTSARRSAAESDIKGRELLYLDARYRRRIQIAEDFFNVLLADLEYARDNEAMAVAYVDLDKIRDRHELKQVSDIVLLEAESQYQQTRRRAEESRARQQASRARLADTLNRPGNLPANLAEPDFSGNRRELPPLEQLTNDALANNSVLLGLRARMQAAQERVQAARAEQNPVLRGEFSSAYYERQLGSRDDLRAGLVLDVPLYKGGVVQAGVAAAQAELRGLQAQYARAEMAVRQSVLETWQKINILRVQREEVQALSAYRDLYLDRSRALYELEVKADLGDAMVRASEARLHTAQTEYGLALTWARLDALTGAPLDAKAGAAGIGQRNAPATTEAQQQ